MFLGVEGCDMANYWLDFLAMVWCQLHTDWRTVHLEKFRTEGLCISRLQSTALPAWWTARWVEPWSWSGDDPCCQSCASWTRVLSGRHLLLSWKHWACGRASGFATHTRHLWWTPFVHMGLLLLLSCVNCHISRLVDASQIRVSSSRSVKPLSPFGGLCIMQSSMMCCTDWFGAPHSHSEVDFRPHLFMASPNLPSFTRYLRPYDAPGSQMPSCSRSHPMCVGIRHHCPCPPL